MRVGESPRCEGGKHSLRQMGSVTNKAKMRCVGLQDWAAHRCAVQSKG